MHVFSYVFCRSRESYLIKTCFEFDLLGLKYRFFIFAFRLDILTQKQDLPQ